MSGYPNHHWFHGTPLSTRGLISAAMTGTAQVEFDYDAYVSLIENGLALVERSMVMHPTRYRVPASTISSLRTAMASRLPTGTAWVEKLSNDEVNAFAVANSTPCAELLVAGWVVTRGGGFGLFQDLDGAGFVVEHLQLMNLSGAVAVRGMEFKRALLSMRHALSDDEASMLRTVLQDAGDASDASAPVQALMSSMDSSLIKEFNKDIEKFEMRGAWRKAMSLQRESANVVSARRFVALPVHSADLFASAKWEVAFPWGSVSDVVWSRVLVRGVDLHRVAWELSRSDAHTRHLVNQKVDRAHPSQGQDVGGELKRLLRAYRVMRKGECAIPANYERALPAEYMMWGENGSNLVYCDSVLFDVLCAATVATISHIKGKSVEGGDFVTATLDLVPSGILAGMQQYGSSRRSLVLLERSSDLDPVSRCVLGMVRDNVAGETNVIDHATKVHAISSLSGSISRQIIRSRIESMIPNTWVGGEVW